MIDPLVTIIVCAYQRITYLPQALASARAQTFQDFEIIISDDGPSQAIEEVVHSFRDPRLHYRQNGKNLGIALNHAAAFHEARGKYLANLDDDDLWEPEFLAKLIPPLEADPDLVVAFCDHHLIDQNGKLLRRLTDFNSHRYRRSTLAPGRHQPFLEMAVVHEAIPMAMGAVFRKSMLDGAELPARMGGCYDHWLAYLAAKDGKAIYYHPERLTRYRVHAGSGSVTRGIHNLRNATYVRSRFAADPQLAPYREKLLNNLGVCYGKMALLLLDRRRYRNAWIVEKRALSLMNRPKTMLGLLKNTALRLTFPQKTTGKAALRFSPPTPNIASSQKFRLLFICSSLEPGRDGVGDYVRLLAQACARQGHSCAVLGLSDPHVTASVPDSLFVAQTQIRTLRLPASMDWTTRLQLACAFRDEVRPDWISFQLVPYAFQKRGMLYGLTAKFQKLIQGVPLHLMFHELWVGAGRPSPLRFHLIGFWQRHAIRHLLRELRPHLVTASNPVYAAMLKSIGADASVLPLFGNVPLTETPVPAAIAGRLAEIGIVPANRESWWIGVFFGALHEQWKPEPFLSLLLRAARQAKKQVGLLIIGRAGRAGEAIWENLLATYGSQAAFITLGEQSPEAISSVLQIGDFGVAASPWQLIGKSGTVAAMLEHGLPVMVTRDDFRPFISTSEPPSHDPLLHLCDDQLEAKLVAGLPKRSPQARLDTVASQLCAALQAAAPTSS